MTSVEGVRGKKGTNLSNFGNNVFNEYCKATGKGTIYQQCTLSIKLISHKYGLAILKLLYMSSRDNQISK